MSGSEPSSRWIDGEPVGDARVWALTGGELVAIDAPGDVGTIEELDPTWDHVLLVGPADADGVATRDARRALAAIVRALGPAVAHGGLVLPGGFRAAYGDADTIAGRATRLTDRRDAVLLALALLGTDAIDRIGGVDRVLRALFGERATKPLGRALARAVDEGWWDDVHLAAAASDLLGPEQLTDLLATGSVPVAGPAAVERLHELGSAHELGDLLTELLGGFTEARRATLIRDLRDRTRAWVVDRPARERRQSFASSIDPSTGPTVAEAHRTWLDQLAAALSTPALRTPPAMVGPATRGALAEPDPRVAPLLLSAVVRSAVAARVLVRLVIGSREGELLEALDAHAPLIDLLALAPEIDGLTASLPSPSLRAVDAIRQAMAFAASGERGKRWIDGTRLDSRDLDGFVEARLRDATHHASVACQQSNELIGLLRETGRPVTAEQLAADPYLGLAWIALLPWRHPLAPDPTRWRLRSDVRGPDGRPLLARSLAERRALDPDAPEHLLDQLWHAETDVECVDVLDREVETFRLERGAGLRTILREVPEPDPTRPGLESVRGAVVRSVELLRMGAEAPARPRSWAAFVDGLHGSFDTAQLLTRTFKVPARLLEQSEGATVPGLGLQVRTGVNVRLLADWADYMGNCLMSHYADDAAAGHCVILGLFDGDRLVYNLELIRRRGRWVADEFESRFNDGVSREARAAVDAWVDTLNPPRPTDDAVRVRPVRRPPRARGGGGSRGRSQAERRTHLDRLRAHLVRALTLPGTASARGAAGELAGALPRPPADGAPTAVLDALLHRPRQLDAALDAALASGGFAPVWTLTANDPLLEAAIWLEDDEGAPWSSLVRLLATPPGARSHSTLLRDPTVLEGWKMHLVATAARDRLLAAIDGDAPPVLTALHQHPHRDAVLALTIRHTARRVAEAGGAGAVRVRRDELRVPVTAEGIVEGHPMEQLLAIDGAWGDAWRWASRADGATVDPLRGWTELRVENRGAPLLLTRAAWTGDDWPRWWARATRAQRRR